MDGKYFKRITSGTNNIHICFTLKTKEAVLWFIENGLNVPKDMEDTMNNLKE